MATTKPGVQYVQIERVQFWADPQGEIHITTDDPDARDVFKHTTISNRETSKRYHPTFYRQLAQLLTQYGKLSPDGPATRPSSPAPTSAPLPAVRFRPRRLFETP